MKNLFIAFILSLLTAGCANKSPMTYSAADQLGKMGALISMCANEGYVNKQTLLEAMDAMNYAIGTWSSPRVDIMNRTEKEFLAKGLLISDCQYVYQFIDQSNQDKQLKRNEANKAVTKSMQDINKAVNQNKPTTCFTNGIGNMATTTCY